MGKFLNDEWSMKFPKKMKVMQWAMFEQTDSTAAPINNYWSLNLGFCSRWATADRP